VLDGADGDTQAIPLRHPEIFAAVVPGQDLLIDDGRVRVRVTGLEADTITAEVITGGVISNRKGVNLPAPSSTCRLSRRSTAPISPSAWTSASIGWPCPSSGSLPT